MNSTKSAWEIGLVVHVSKPVGPYAGGAIPTIKVTGQEAVCTHIPHTTLLPGGTLFRKGNCGVIWSKDSMQVQSHFILKLHPTPWLCEVERVPISHAIAACTNGSRSSHTTNVPWVAGKMSEVAFGGNSLALTLNPKADAQGTSAKDTQGTSSCDADTRAGAMLGRETVVLTELMSQTDERGE